MSGVLVGGISVMSVGSFVCKNWSRVYSVFGLWEFLNDVDSGWFEMFFLGVIYYSSYVFDY